MTQKRASLRELRQLAAEAAACTLCAAELPHRPRPVFRVERFAPILLIGQAPGRRVHETGIPWNDLSGQTLRRWLDLSPEEFYDPDRLAILPTGLCWPGTVRGKGDRPPMPRCAPTWHPRFLELLRPTTRLTLLVGSYAVAAHLPEHGKHALADVVALAPKLLAREIIALPHPSPRNRRWLAQRPWFEREIVPLLRRHVRQALADRRAMVNSDGSPARSDARRDRPRAG